MSKDEKEISGVTTISTKEEFQAKGINDDDAVNFSSAKIEQPMLELHIGDNDITSGTLPITWCVRKDILKKLSEMNCIPYLLLIVAPFKEYCVVKEQRYLIPLKELMTYVSFNYTGENIIFGSIVWKGKHINNIYDVDPHYIIGMRPVDRRSDSAIRIKYGYNLTKESKVFPGFAISIDYSLETTKVEETEPSCASARIDVDVPKGIFAKEPPEWEKQWVNWLFLHKALDQCEFRRRRMFAYSIAPILMIGTLLFRLGFYLFAKGLLIKGISGQSLLHPLTYDSESISAKSKYPLFYIDKWNNPRSLIFMPFTPTIMLAILSLGYIHPLIPFAIYIIILSFIIETGIIGLLTRIEVKLGRKKKKKKKTRVKKPAMTQLDMELLTCSHTTQAFKSVQDLPKSHQTIHLRFTDLKSKICKPFSR